MVEVRDATLEDAKSVLKFMIITSKTRRLRLNTKPLPCLNLKTE